MVPDMAIDRHGTGLSIIRICIGIFFIAEGVGKWRWFAEPSILANQLAGWHQGVAAGSMSAVYLERAAIPYASILARLVPLGEICSGIGLVAGIWTPLCALIAFFMAFNFQFASGALFKSSFLTSGYGLPVLGSTLALAIGGVRLPWSVR
jgi:uncharacterized membrane protein YphA (DoxX/SURF4 family)